MATTDENIRASVSDIYSKLLDKCRADQEAADEKKRLAQEEREAKKAAAKTDDDGIKLTKKERREREMKNWEEVVVGLTGEDLDYTEPKKKKKKYRKWIGEDDVAPAVKKPKKAKKRNYNKEFAPELQMLKSIVADQNRFNKDLEKRFANAAGPATKDAMMPNKTLVELAAAINSGRSNSLGLLREIGSLKKTMADLYLKQQKQDFDLSGGKGSSSDELSDNMLLGSMIANQMYGDDAQIQTGNMQQPPMATSVSMPVQQAAPAQNNVFDFTNIPEFNADSWDGGPAVSNEILHEKTDRELVVEYSRSSGSKRIKAVDRSGAEINGYPIPTADPSRIEINEKDGTAKGFFGESYRLEIIA